MEEIDTDQLSILLYLDRCCTQQMPIEEVQREIRKIKHRIEEIRIADLQKIYL